MNWVVEYDWKNWKKKWSSKIYSKGQLLYNTMLESHLVTKESLRNLCYEYFEEVEIVSAPSLTSEDYLICKILKKNINLAN
jgi:hypothetical protein